MGAVVRREDQEEIGAKMMIFVLFSFVFAATHAFPAGPLNFNPSMVHQDGPLNMDALNMLHADAVKFGSAAAKDNKWFEAVDAQTLDKLITEMNTMNRWFAKTVKYWDDFTSGGDGSKVLAEQGKGIDVDEPVDGGSGGSEGSADGAADEQDADADAADASEPADDAADAADPANEGEEPAEGKEGGDGETPAEGEEGTDGEKTEEGGDEEKPAEEGEGGEEEKPAEGDEGADKEDPAEGGEGGDTETGADDGATEGGDDADGGDTEAKGKDGEDAATRKRMKKRRMKKRF